jgi:hypothetical protein
MFRAASSPANSIYELPIVPEEKMHSGFEYSIITSKFKIYNIIPNAAAYLGDNIPYQMFSV